MEIHNSLRTPPPQPSSESCAGPGAGVLEKAMGLLNIVSGAPQPMTFTALLRTCGLPKATLHRILATLVREGLLRQDPYTRAYRLGFRLLELAHEVWSDFDLRLAAQDELVRLRDTLGETIQLFVPDGESLVLIASEEAGHDFRATSKVGLRLPLNTSAAGRIVIAYLDSGRQAELMGPAGAWRAELDLARARGYLIEDLSEQEGLITIAAPIFDIESRPIGSVSISAPFERIGVAQAHSLSSALIGATRRISHNAGGQVMSIMPREVPAEGLHSRVECVSQHHALLGEGPIWSPRDGALYWVDILTPSIHHFDVSAGTDTETKLGTMVSLVIPKATGGLLVATPGGIMTFDNDSKRLRPLCHPESDRPGHRYNDGKCDRMGRLWVGSLDMATAANRGNLFRVDGVGQWKKMDSGFTVANGMGWSPDNRHMYFTDSNRRTIYAYDFDLRAGEIANRRPLITFDTTDGTPDGLTVDADGCIWVAVWDAWRISRFSPTGEEMQRIMMPVPRPTSCCFGGENLDTLYVTSASVRLSAEVLSKAPLSGSLFSIQIPGVHGLPETTFAG